jgi:hypothetical protein
VSVPGYLWAKNMKSVSKVMAPKVCTWNVIEFDVRFTTSDPAVQTITSICICSAKY